MEVKMIRICKTFVFDAAHKLPEHKGKCKNLHGHRYKLEIEVRNEVNPNTGMVMDFGDLKQIINDTFIKNWDHSYLNESFENPTAEIMVEHMINWLKNIFNKEGVYAELTKVRLYETPNSYAEWRKEDQ
ncbi:MAG: 6-carboxytetrahydropterin synthase QueD [Tenericutes bacterium]|nr:MAG: 6-carboxytetrahydropterin synthase QueD [Mycoplasmatota bacterium]